MSNPSSFIASKMSFKGRLPLICIALSFFIIIVAVSISAGFRNEIREGISSISGDLQILPQSQNTLGEEMSIERYPAYLDSISKHPAIEKIVPVVSRVGIIKQAEHIHGVLFKAVPDGADSSGFVRIPRRLSQILKLSEGDKMTVYFIGAKTRARRLTVESIYDAILDSDDKLVVYMPLEDMQRVNNWSSDRVSSMEIYLKNAYKSESQIQTLKSDIGGMMYVYGSEEEVPVYCVASMDYYPQLFDWLNLIDFNVVFILLLMIIVAGFNMISGLLILLFESISLIGSLKAFGMTHAGIRKIFVKLSSRIVLKGLLIGNLSAIVLCLIQQYFHVIPLDPVNYFVSYVPVHLNFIPIVLTDVVAYAAILLLMQIPCAFISRIDPAQTMRME